MTSKRRGKGRLNRKAVSLPDRCLKDRCAVHLDHGAFVSLVLAGVETYRRECYGLLLGFERGGVTYVRDVLPYQTARRRPRSVAFSSHRRRILQRIVSQISRPAYLGEFHSHVPQPGVEVCETLSRDDITSAGDRELQILVAVHRSRANGRWRHNADGSLSGPAGPYFVKLRAFRSHATRTGPPIARIAPIRCRGMERNRWKG